MLYQIKEKISKLIFPALALIYLLPQAVGYRPYYQALSVDGPRILILLIIMTSFIVFLKNFSFKNLLELNKSYYYLVLFAIFIFISALTSENVTSSLFLSIKLVTIWILFACSFDYLSNINCHNEELIDKYFINTLLIISFGLSVYALIEFSLQTYVIPNSFRTSFSTIANYEEFITKTITRNGLILAQGPFTWNHGLGGVLCSLLGVVLYNIEKRKIFGPLLGVFFIFALLVTGMRAVYIAITFGILIWIIFRFNLKKILVLLFCFSIALGIYSIKADPKKIIFFSNDIQSFSKTDEYNLLFVGGKQFFDYKRTAEFLNSFTPLSTEEIGSYIENKGTLGLRFIGLVENLLDYKNWWLTGYGTGSFQKPDLVKSSAFQYNDPGLIMVILFEFGILPFMLFMYLILTAFFKSLKNTDWMFGVGIASWFVFSLSSWAIWPMMLITVFVVKIYKKI